MLGESGRGWGRGVSMREGGRLGVVGRVCLMGDRTASATLTGVGVVHLLLILLLTSSLLLCNEGVVSGRRMWSMTMALGGWVLWVGEVGSSSGMSDGMVTCSTGLLSEVFFGDGAEPKHGMMGGV